ncbi:hypothetical protein ACU4GA_19125 [Methylobacterium oryzae CBMB20]
MDLSEQAFHHGLRALISGEEVGAMTITTSINAVGPVKATEMIQSARAEAAIEHRAGLHTVSMTVPAPDDTTSRPHADGREFPVSQARVVDISV